MALPEAAAIEACADARQARNGETRFLTEPTLYP